MTESRIWTKRVFEYTAVVGRLLSQIFLPTYEQRHGKYATGEPP